MNPQAKLLIELLDSPIAFNPTFARVAGNSLASGMLLSQLWYWAKAMGFSEFYKTNEELQNECFLSRRDFESARKTLTDLGIISFAKKGMPLKTYYTLNLDKLLELINNMCTNQNVQGVQTGLHNMSKQDGTQCTSLDVHSVHSIINNREYTENTTENIPPNPQGGKMGHPPNLIVNENLPYPPKEHSDEVREQAVLTWLSIIRDKIQTKGWIGFTTFELEAIKHRARCFPVMRHFEIESELIQLDKWAWEGLDIEDAARCGFRKIQAFRPHMRKRVKQDNAGNPILSIERLNIIRENEIKQAKQEY